MVISKGQHCIPDHIEALVNSPPALRPKPHRSAYQQHPSSIAT